MIGRTIVVKRKSKGEAEKPFWISYADLMTALMVLFLVAMSVAMMAVTNTVRDVERQKHKLEETNTQAEEQKRRLQTALVQVEADKKKLTENEERLKNPVFLNRIDDYRENPRALRVCYRGLLHAYFLYDTAMGSASGRENWGLLRNYLAGRSNFISTTGFQPSWVGTLLKNPEVLGPDPGPYYGKELFRGGPNGLTMSARTWRSPILLASVARRRRSDRSGDEDSGDASRAGIPRLLDLLHRHPLALSFGLAKLLTRYKNCASATLHEQLRDSAVEAWGNPWLAINEAKWARVSQDVRRMIADWLKPALMQKFFNLLAEDGRNDTRRLRFWERYHKSIDAMYFALGETALTHPGPDFKEARKQMEGLRMTLTQAGSRDNQCFHHVYRRACRGRVRSQGKCLLHFQARAGVHSCGDCVLGSIVASRDMTRRLRFERRRYLVAKIGGRDATAGENAARNAKLQAGNDARYLGQPQFDPRKRRAEFRHRPQEALGIGVSRVAE